MTDEFLNEAKEKYLNNELVNEIFNDAIRLWGEESQAMMLIEEMAELIKAICKALNRSKKDIENLHEELVDVEICLGQARRIFKLDDNKRNKIRAEKLNRLEEKIKKYKIEYTIATDDEYFEDDYVDMPYIEDRRK